MWERHRDPNHRPVPHKKMWLADRPPGSDGLCLALWDGPDAAQAEADGYQIDEPCLKAAHHTGRHTWEPLPAIETY